MPELDSEIALIKQQMCSLQHSYARQMLWVQGSVGQCHARARALVQAFAGCCLWVGEPQSAPEGVSACTGKQAHRQLGREFSLLVFDAFAGFDPNAFGQVIGTLKAGGMCLLLTPAADKWPEYADPEAARLVPYPLAGATAGQRFIRHLVRVLKQDSHVCHWADQLHLAALPAEPEQTPARPPYRTPEQQQLVVKLAQALLSAEPEPQVVTADRGRGKSAALGLLAQHLLAAGLSVQVTAPHREAVASLYQMLGEQSAEVAFSTPGHLLQTSTQADVLLVDEAAAIPAPVLTGLLEDYPRIVFASTLHGYEGTGRGFAVRFRRVLDKRRPGWQGHSLYQPVRWQAGDPLEALSYRLLLLAAEPDKPQGGEVEYQQLNRDDLLADPVQLENLFGLLVLAHYRTTPGDLRILLDTPGLEVWAARQGEIWVAAMLVVAEGGLDEVIAGAILRGERRPPGHLLPQTLLAQEGLAEVAPLKGLRVMRIAVHPRCQRQGIGQQLLAALKVDAEQRGLDWLGTVFGATHDLLPFWRRAGYQPLRLGQNRDAVGGTYAAVMLKPLTPAAEQLVKLQSQYFANSLQRLLPGVLSQLEPELLADLMPDQPRALNAREWLDVETFAHAHRPFESCLPALVALAGQGGVGWQRAGLSREDQQLLICAVLQQHGWPQLEARFAAGRKALVRRLRAAIALLLADHKGRLLAQSSR